MAVIASLSVALGVDNSQLRRGLNRATQENQRYANRTRSVFASLRNAIAGAGIVAGLQLSLIHI